MKASGVLAVLWVSVLGASSCKDQGELISSQERIESDAQLFTLVTQDQPFVSYTLFPRVDSVTSGTLNGSTAHQPLVRVSMNSTALSALRSDTLPDGEEFPDGSVIFKQIIVGGRAALYAVMYKQDSGGLSGSGWLWAEFYPDGRPFISLALRGVNCTSCHSRELGPRHDFVRTFERQR